MLNDPPPGEDKKRRRRVHPLEQRPEPPAPTPDDQQPQGRITLHIPVVQPRLTYALIGINALIFFIGFFVLSEPQLNALYDWGGSSKLQVLAQGEYHRLLTSMFLHAGLAHILFNMYALYIIGATVERFFGHVRFAIVYFLGGLAGSLLSVILNPAGIISVGASGAVFAIVGGEMVFLYKHRKLLGQMAQRQLRQLVIVAGINFVYGFATAFVPGGVNIDNWGHVGGFIGGLIVAWLIGPVFIPKRHPQNPDALTIEDINPLERTYQPLLAYVSGLLIVLILAATLV